MVYRVQINYTSFVFDDLEEASGFARTAKLSMVKDGRNEVVIYIEDAEEEEE